MTGPSLDQLLTGSSPRRHDRRAPFLWASRHGYSQESRELWGVDGRLLVTATELVTIIT